MSFKAGNGTKTITMSISVIAVFALAFWLIYKSTQDFLNSTVTSTIDATDIPLSEVYFPSVTICNINQVGYLLMHMYFHCTVFTVILHSTPPLIQILPCPNMITLLLYYFYLHSLRKYYCINIRACLREAGLIQKPLKNHLASKLKIMQQTFIFLKYIFHNH